MSEKLSLSQRIHNAEGSQAVEDIHARHSYLHAMAFGKEEWSTLWSKDDETSWGHFFGRMRGFDSIWSDSVTLYDARTYRDYLKVYKIYPEVGGKDPRPLAECAMHTICTDVIEVAEDGMSARGAFLTPGNMFCMLNPDKHRTNMYLWERYGSDFVYENGQWLYIHEQVCPDFGGNGDTDNFAAKAYQNLVDPPPPPPPLPPEVQEAIMPPVDEPGPLHFRYTPVQTVQNTVPWPEPYKTLDDDNTYAPFRHLDKSKED
jgi:hypothetical protein